MLRRIIIQNYVIDLLIMSDCQRILLFITPLRTLVYKALVISLVSNISIQ